MASRIDTHSGSLSLLRDPSLSSLWLLSSQILILLVATQNRAKQERTSLKERFKMSWETLLCREGALPCETRWLNSKSSLRAGTLYSCRLSNHACFSCTWFLPTQPSHHIGLEFTGQQNLPSFQVLFRNWPHCCGY